MATKTIEFAVSDEDLTDLEELVDYFSQGNRSAYLQATIGVMKSVKLAEELRELQAYAHGKLGERGMPLEDIPEITRRILRGSHRRPRARGLRRERPGRSGSTPIPSDSRKLYSTISPSCSLHFL
ncbi:hypothetical protein [Nonomuraea sp. SYSU D8015]|uniref:hypothetical protein n=1 Tax=Nonomuraea sp. SYSU D8015 TaxID=2593644 RepID=UPI0016600D8F|nr:hypothetical protein [Nonomuraea sp. SYSU D8015]